MKKILVHMDIQKNGEYDIFHSVDYSKFNEIIQKKYDGNCPNVGNKLWFQAIVSEISDSNNEIEYYNPTMLPDEINQRYDLVVAPMANIFSLGFREVLERLSKKFENIKIPVYVVACGVQADSYDDLNEIVEVLREPATKFIKTIYATGGEFALRGYFTKDFFDKLGFKSAVVTGCPSMFQLGRGLQISKAEISKEELRPVLNGTVKFCKPFLKEYENSVYVDQNEYYNLLYNSEFFEEKEIDKSLLLNLIKNYGLFQVKMCLEGRVKLFVDMVKWKNYMQDKKINYSFGGRIHGNLMPILCGIPATIYACDSRTREMAEFFHLPIEDEKTIKTRESLYDIYDVADYSMFNKKFEEKYDNFEKFLQDAGIVNKINQNNEFFGLNIECEDKVVNYNELEKLRMVYEKNRKICESYEYILNLKRNFGHVKNRK